MPTVFNLLLVLAGDLLIYFQKVPFSDDDPVKMQEKSSCGKLILATGLAQTRYYIWMDRT